MSVAILAVSLVGVSQHDIRTWIDINVWRMPYAQAKQKDVVRRILWDERIEDAVDALPREDIPRLARSILRNGSLLLAPDDLESLLRFNLEIIARSPLLCEAAWWGTYGDELARDGWDKLPELPREVIDGWVQAMGRASSRYLDTLAAPLATVEELELFMTPHPVPDPFPLLRATLSARSRSEDDELLAAMDGAELRPGDACRLAQRLFRTIAAMPSRQRDEVILGYLLGPPYRLRPASP